ncbi:MAG: 50S ribosomal protein L11 methyltransferase [Planctomycetaceae bacterium]
MRLGHASEVTGVDLDEAAIATARANAKLNRQNMKFVHADAFPTCATCSAMAPSTTW